MRQVAVVNAAAAIDEASNKAHESKVAFDAVSRSAQHLDTDISAHRLNVFGIGVRLVIQGYYKASRVSRVQPRLRNPRRKRERPDVYT